MNFNEHAHVQTLDMTSLVAGSVGLNDNTVNHISYVGLALHRTPHFLKRYPFVKLYKVVSA